MADSFDPYHKWLGIPGKDQPPHHYRLLGIERFETDPDVIESAADQRMAHVRTFQTGQNSALSQRILNELSAAKICLLDPQKRAAYDASLRSTPAVTPPAPQNDAGAAVAVPVRAVPVVRPTPVFVPLPPSASSPLDAGMPDSETTRETVGWQMLALIAGATFFCLAVAVVVAIAARGDGWQDAANGSTGDSSPPILTPVRTSEAPRAVASQSVAKAPPHGPPTEDRAPVTPARPAEAPIPQTVVQPPVDQGTAVLAKLGAKVKRANDKPGRPIVKIDLSNSPVTDDDLALFKAFSELSTLETLVLAGAQSVGDSGAAHLAALTELRMLDLSRTHVGDTGAIALRRLVHLEWLSLADTPLGDEGAAALAELPGLQTLVANNTLIGDAALEHWPPATPLRRIEVRSTRVTAEGIAALRKRLPSALVVFDRSNLVSGRHAPPAANPLPAAPAVNASDPAAVVRRLGGSSRRDMEFPDEPIAAVHIDNDALVDEDLEFLDRLPRLMSLDLHSNKLTDAALARIGEMGSLRSLIVDRARISDDGLAQIDKLTNLVTLQITRAPITDEGIKQLKNLGHLEVLDLSQTQVTGESLGPLRLPHLQKLVLNDTNVGDKTTATLGRLASLQNLFLQDTEIGDQGLLKLKRLRALKELDVSRTRVTNEGIINFKKGRKTETVVLNRTELPVRRPVSVPDLAGAPVDAISKDGKTKILGGLGELFRDEGPPGAWLIGFEASTDDGFDRGLIKSLQPIYRSARGEVRGKQYGATGKNTVTVKAKEGYVVAGIVVKSGLFIDGMAVVFMRYKDGKINPADSFESEWVGGFGGSERTKLGLEGRRVVGIIGKVNQNQCTGIGLLLDKESDAQNRVSKRQG